MEDSYSERLKRNPRYSLRAFSHFLEINDSTLHQLIRGRRKISGPMALKLGTRLGLEPNQVEQLTSSPYSQREEATYSRISNDQFRFMSRWYYDAILDLTSTKGFRSDVPWIAKRLGLTALETRTAIDTLLRLKFLEVRRGRLHACLNDSLYNFDGIETSEAAKQYQIDLLEKSASSIRGVPRTLRNHTSFTVKMKKSSIDRLNKRIRQMQKEIVAALKEDTGPKEEVYAFQVSFFPLTQIVSGGENE